MINRKVQRTAISAIIIITLSSLHWLRQSYIQVDTGNAKSEESHVNRSIFEIESESVVTNIKRKCDNLAAQYNIQNMDRIDHITCSNFKQWCGVQSCKSMLDVVYLWVNGSVIFSVYFNVRLT